MSRDLLVVCGSRREPSRTRALTDAVADHARDAGFAVDTLDLRETTMELFDGRDPADYDDQTRAAVERFLEAERYVVASPVYFGGISGALKNLLDHIPYEEFKGPSRTAGLVMAGRDRRHEHVLDAHLRSTLVYLGVDVPTTSVFATEAAFDGATLVDRDVRDRLGRLVDAVDDLHGR